VKKTPLTEKKFDLEIEAIRALIQAQARPFADPSTGSGRAAQKERVDRGSKDLEYFGKTYFPHYISSPCSALHRYICERYPAMIFRAMDPKHRPEAGATNQATIEPTGQGDKQADAAPRGNAKSTWTSLIFVLWSMAYKYRSFPLIVSETVAQSEDFMLFIKSELEVNERLAQDFPDLAGVGRIWRADMIVTRNGIKVRGAGAGQKLRGMRHGSKRPDLVICDDLENDEAVESPDQRKKLEKWFFKALMKIGQKNTVYIVIGTILHYESLLNSLLNKPGWKGKKFKAVITYSQSKLWEKWEEIFVDISVGKEAAEAASDAFFKKHEKAMLEGTEVLWPEVEDYYYLMKMRISEGPAYFESEKQNEPINPEDAVFLEEWLVDYDEGDVDLAGLPHAGACDPSLGKRNRRGDPSAIMGGRMKDRILYLDVADIERRQPDKIMTDILSHHERDRFDKIRMETVQFQEFFAREFEKLAHEKKLTINVDDYVPNTDKDLRIVRLQPWIKNGWIRFKSGVAGMRELKRHLIYYRPKNKGGPDDGPDALEMLLGLCEAGLIPATSVSSERTAEDYHAERPSARGRVRMPDLRNRLRLG
jgi:predicted phage terminase large subunit-like protein